jgi:hypothetical protein
MILYHYTCPCDLHLGSILGDEMIRTTESNIGSGFPDMKPFGEHVGPDVVWLTTSEYASVGQGLSGSIHDKTAARIVVDVDDAEPWERWCKHQGINPRWRRLLEKNTYPHQWYVVERDIPQADWVSTAETASEICVRLEAGAR